eukprot:TRINITY_DN19385_c0_g1_i1.p1 TRINITY_DN19385_c0_g1~~TRINITY_DN19385_c0_g1_i1.p1  ORF type:complete len:418 (-),score=118.05 TRINITY_DN19385_c0_g1_i1:107-1198(-)
MDSAHPRLVVVGCTGAGKSTLVNSLGGLRCVCKSGKDDSVSFEWSETPIFDTGASTAGVTQYTSFANMNFLGAEEKPFVCVDTPGHDDPAGVGIAGNDKTAEAAREKLDQQAGDLHDKLQKMGFVNALLVVHNDVHSNRLNPATMEILQKIDQMFSKSDTNVWDHVIMAYSKCDADARGWRAGLDDKKAAMQKELQKNFPKCKAKIPIVCLSGVCFDEGADKKAPAGDFDQLWTFLSKRPKLSTENIQKFEGLTVQIEKVLAERDLYQRQAAARKYFFQVTMYCLAFLSVIFGICRPLINFSSTTLDELTYVLLFMYCIGFIKFYDFMTILWDDYILEFLMTKKWITKQQRTEWSFLLKEKKD